MRFTIAIILIFATLASTSPRNRIDNSDVNKYIQECGAELNISSSEMNKYKTPDVPMDRIGQCFTKCMFEKFGVFDKESGFKIEPIFKLMSENNHPLVGDIEFIAAIEKCVKESNLIQNACERAYHGSKCLNSDNFKKKNVE
ncbi:general odorant-binding protein 99a-like [Episyrphus balteatus]|uniref:general odorant-binding protein 99a-like n=1 Tax=Episyrphus balteatus TaxID=286459 RepID=UPI002484DD4D|nr:general odorant-binding protein 99a-like [Episyrphus balteatus]